MKSSALKFVIILLLCVAGYSARAQKSKITGIVFSSASRETIADATIKLLNQDSIIVGSIITDTLGNFSFANLPSGAYILQAEAMSYSITAKPVRITGKIVSDTILMESSFKDLQSVVVSAKKPAVLVKQDTIEYNANNLKVNRNATVEDAFKKIAGIEVSKNGSIKAQGETITQIYVDGKPFFGNDLKAVTQNFPADIIDKIQIIDKKSEQAQATKSDDGSYEKIINITLKKNSKKGFFGKENLGYGTGKHYEAKATANFFNNDKKFSVIAGANNTGRNDNGAYNSNGIADNKQLKINYSNKLGNNFDFSAWAGYDENKTVAEQLISRQNIFTDSAVNYFENNNSSRNAKNVYAGLYFEYKPDTFTLIRFNESAGFSNNSYASSSQFNSALISGYKMNNGSNEINGASKTPYLNGQINVSRRLNNTGRNIFLNLSNSANNNQIVSYNNFINYSYPFDTAYYSSLINQMQFNNSRNINIGTTIGYTEPLAPKSTLNISYAYNRDNNDMQKDVNDFSDTSNLYNLFNDTLSNHFNNNTTSNTASLNYNYNSRRIGFGIGGRWKQSITESDSPDKDSAYSTTFTGFLPGASFYSNGKKNRLSLNYYFYVKTPQPYQLQPVIDNTNPLYVMLGNPALKYGLVQMVRYNFKHYNAKKESGYNSNGSFSATTNNISNSITFDNVSGKQISKALNIGNAYNWTVWFTYFAPLHIGDDKIKWSANLQSAASKQITLLNEAQNIIRNNFVRILFGLNYDTPEWINIRTDFSVSRQVSKYSLQNSINNTSYSFTISPDCTFKLFNKTEVNLDYDYRKTTVRTAAFNTSINMFNASITQYLTTKKDMSFTLRAFDIFNQNTGVWRVYGDNFIQDTKSTVLSRFFLVSMNFNLSKFNK